MAHSHGETQTAPAELLLGSLEELTEEDLKKFKYSLIHLVHEKYQHIPRGHLDNLDRMGIADKMITFYGEADVLNVTLTILRKMNLNNLAQKLNKDLKKGPQEPRRTHPPVVSNHSAVPFVDQNRTAIIQRVSLVDPILDDLHEHIGGEKYNNIRAASTSQAKMRKLYELLNTDRLKELFFDALKKNESYLVEELLSL